MKIELSKAEVGIHFKWKLFRYLSIGFATIYFLILYQYYQTSFENEQLLQSLFLFVGFSFISNHYSVKYKNHFLKIVKEKIEVPKKHKMLQLMEEKRKKEEEINND